MIEHSAKNLGFKGDLSGLKTSLKHVKTFFGDITEKKVTFCFDTSGSMYRIFYHFREHLVEKLFQMLFSEKSQKFNVVLFNSSIHQCFPKHVLCSHEHIVHATQWMNKAYYESKSNMLGGLLKSFEDDPDVVYLISDGFPSNDRQELISHLPHITKGRPIRSIMITTKNPPENVALDFLEDIAEITQGSLSVIGITDYGAVEVLMPIYYESRPIGIRRSVLTSYLDKKMNCLTGMQAEKTLKEDPMTELPLTVPFSIEDRLSGKKCPFYHPFYHWYWPQYWHNNYPGPFSMWSSKDKQYKCMRSDFRESRAFISGRKYLQSHHNPSHGLPYAGLMLINKRVLACNHKDSNNYYMGKVLKQISPFDFIVKFDINEEYNEVQRTNLGEMVDIEEQKRHSISINDYVLAPIDSKQGAYDIGMVTKGQECREFTTSFVSQKNIPLVIKFLSNNLQKEIETNESIFLSTKLKDIIESGKYIFKDGCSDVSPSNQENGEEEVEEDSMYAPSVEINRRGSNNNCVYNDPVEYNPHDYSCSSMHHGGCCPMYSGISGKAAPPVDDGKALTLDQIREQVYQNSMKIKDVEESAHIDDHCHSEDDDDDDDDEEESKYSEVSKDVAAYPKSEDDSVYEKGHCKDEFTETDLNWCILRLLNKHTKHEVDENKRPPWRYWGKQGIPDVIDPPNSEPYNNPPHFDCLMPKPVGNGQYLFEKTIHFACPVQWPSVNFHEVDPHRISNVSPEKMYNLFKHQVHEPSQRLKRDASVGRDSLPPEEFTKKLLERRSNHLLGGYPKLDIKNPYADSVRPLLSSNSAFGSIRGQQNVDKCLNLLEKSRIENQIQRDEANFLRYVENKPKGRQSVVQFQ